MMFSPTNTYARESEEKMAALSGLELRWPFFNLQLAQFAFSSPDRIRQRGRINKFVHRHAMNGLLPPMILGRESKADFMITYRRYLLGMESQFTTEIPSRQKDWVSSSRIVDMYKQTQKGLTPDGLPEWQLWGLFGCDALSM